MTDAASLPDMTGATAPTAAEQRPSLMAQVIRRTMSRWGARVGVIWVAALVLSAVFAPFIANSHPIALQHADGTWTSPLFTYLGAMDVLLLVAFFAGLVILFIRRLSLTVRIWLLAAVVGIGGGLSWMFVEPPRTVVYESYREGLTSGKYRKAINVPVPYSPSDRLRDQPELRLTGPTFDHIMGTTLNGADLFANMLYATRIALSIGFIATGIALVLGIVVGGLMGYFSGIVDLIGMRFVEIFSAIPTLLLLLILVAAVPPEWSPYMLYLMMIIIGLTGWVGYALFIRAEFLKLRRQDFVQAAIACGLPLRSILFRHMLPNGVAPVLVSASFGVASAILAESTLSFLGIGLVEEGSWGKLLNQALGAGGTFFWWIALYPGLAIFLTVFAYNLIGEALRDAIDPHLNKAAHL
jgi:peptide/nickel transport system permease protein